LYLILDGEGGKKRKRERGCSDSLKNQAWGEEGENPSSSPAGKRKKKNPG